MQNPFNPPRSINCSSHSKLENGLITNAAIHKLLEEIKDLCSRILEEITYIDDDSTWAESDQEEEDADDELSDL